MSDTIEQDIDWTFHPDDPDDTAMLGMHERGRVDALWQTAKTDVVSALKSTAGGDDFHDWLIDHLARTDFFSEWFRRSVLASDTEAGRLDAFELASRISRRVLYAACGGEGVAKRMFHECLMNAFTGGTRPSVNVFVGLLKLKFQGNEEALRGLEQLSVPKLLRLYASADASPHWTLSSSGYMTAPLSALQRAVEAVDYDDIRALRHEPGWGEEQSRLRMDATQRGDQLPLFRENAVRVVASLLEDDDEEGFEDVDWTPDPDDPDVASPEAMVSGHESAHEIYQDENVRIIKPLSATTFNRYAALAKAREFSSYPSDLKEDTCLTFVVIVKLPLHYKQPPFFLDFDAEDVPDSTTRVWLDRSRVSSALWPVVDSVRKGLSVYALEKLGYYAEAGAASGLDYSFEVGVFTTMLMHVGEYAQVAEMLKGLYAGNKRMETQHAWPMIATLLKQGKLDAAKEVIGYAGISTYGVRFDADSFWVSWPDLDGMTHLFDRMYEKQAEQLFSGDAYNWFDSTHMTWQDVYDYIDEKSFAEIKQLLIGMPYGDEEGRQHRHTAQSVEELDSRDLKDMFEENEDTFEEITDAIKRAGWSTDEQCSESAYTDGYTDAIENALGAKEHAWLEFPGTGRDGKAVPDHRIGFKFPYTIVRDWLEYSDDNGNDARESSDFNELAFAGSERVVPQDDYSRNADFDKEAFNDYLRDNLPREMQWELPSQHDPNQPELIAQDTQLKVYNAQYPNGAYFRMTREQAEAFLKEHPEQASKEAWEAHVKQP